jgi:hypothetical protein
MCAGLFLANMVGDVGVATIATLLAAYQPLLMGMSIPLHIATPFFISKSLAKIFKGGCIISSYKKK